MEYRTIRSPRRTMAIQITLDGQVLVRCPLAVSERQVEDFVNRKAAWIQKHLQGASHTCRPLADIPALTERAKKEIPLRVAYYAPMIGVEYGRITIRCQKTRWGSCSGKGNLNFNCMLMLAPSEVLDYVVIHELCHRRQMNHSPRFWAEVARICPDYQSCRRWLKENGPGLLARCR